MSKMLSKILVGIVSAITFVSVAAANYLQSDDFVNQLSSKIAEVATNSLETRVEIGQIATESSHSLGAKNIIVYDKRGEEIASVDYAQVNFSLLNFLEKNPLDGIDDITVSGVKAQIVQREDGSFNFQDLISEEESKNNLKCKIHVREAEAKVIYEGKELQIEDAQADLDFANYPAISITAAATNQGAKINVHGNVGSSRNAISVEAENILVENYLEYAPEDVIPEQVTDIKGRIDKLQASVVTVGDDIYYSGEAELSEGEAVILDKKVENIEGLFVVDEKRALIFARAACEGQEASVHGKVILGEGTPVFDLTAEAKDFEPDKIINNGNFSGRINLAAHLTGPIKNPSVDADVEIPEAQVEGYSFRNVTTKLHYADSKVFAKDIYAEALSGKVTGEAEFNALDYSFVGHFKVDSIELADIQKLGVNIAGTVSGDIAADGVADDLSKLNIYGSVYSEGLTYFPKKEGREPIGVNSVHTSFAKLGKDFILDFFSAKMENGGELGLKGKLFEDKVDFNFYGSNLDLSKIVIPQDGESNNPLAGRMNIRGAFTGTFSDPNLDVEFDASNGKMFFQPFDSLSGSAHGNLNSLSLNDISMNHGKSIWKLNGLMAFKDKQSTITNSDITDMNIYLDMTINNTRVEDMIKPFAPDLQMTGNLDNSLDITGTVGNPSVNGAFRLYEGSFKGVLINNIKGNYDVRKNDGKLNFTLYDVLAETIWGDAEVSGSVSDLENTPLFNLKLKVNNVLLEKFADKMPYEVSGSAYFDGILTGNLNNPIFNGELDGENIVLNGEALEDVGGYILFKDNIIKLSDFGFDDKYGSYVLDGYFNNNNNVLVCDLKIDNIDIATLLAISNFKSNNINGVGNGLISIKGTIDSIKNTDFSKANNVISMLKNGLLDSINATIHLNIDDGYIGNYPVNDILADMHLDNSILKIDSFEGKEGAAGKFSSKGFVNLKKDINIDMSMNNIDAGILGGVSDNALAIDGIINGVVQCRGEFSNPVVDMSVEALNIGTSGINLDKAYAFLCLKNGIININDMALEKKITVAGVDNIYRGTAKGTIPVDALSTDEAVCQGKNMDVLISLDDTELSVLPAISPYIDWAFGETDGKVRLGGNILDPTLNGEIKLNGGRMGETNEKLKFNIDKDRREGAAIKINGLETLIDNVSMLVKFKDKVVTLDHLSGNMGEGDFNITGNLIFAGRELDDYNLSVECNKLDILTEFYKGNADLTANITKATVPRVRELFQKFFADRKKELELDNSDDAVSEEKENKQAENNTEAENNIKNDNTDNNESLENKDAADSKKSDNANTGNVQNSTQNNDEPKKIVGFEERFRKMIEGMSIINGKLTLYDAIISIPSIESSDDPLPNVFMDLDLELGDNVKFYVKQMANLHLAGNAHIGGSTNYPLSSGVIYVEKGTISYLKNVFKVRECSLLFNKGNQKLSILPDIKLLADTKIGTRRVFISMDGPLYGNDLLQLSAEPQLSHENIIKLLTLRNSYRENEDGWGNTANSMLMTGLQMALLGDVEESLRNTMNLDYFSIERDVISGISSSSSSSSSSSGSSDSNSSTAGSTDTGVNDKEIYNVILGKNLHDKHMVKVSKSVNAPDYKLTYEYDFNNKISFTASHDYSKGSLVGFEARFSF